jgi:hypothetical protein
MAGTWTLDGWYYSRAEALLGPVSTGELRLLVAYGWLQPADTVWRGWKRDRTCILFPALVGTVLNRSERRNTRPADVWQRPPGKS